MAIAPDTQMSPRPRTGRSVLIVDDHDAYRAAARWALEAGGYVVVGEAGNATAGIEAARLLRPDVVLLDVCLPDRNGFAAAREIAEAAETGIVVLMSASPESDFGDRVRTSRASGFIPKERLSARALEAFR